ncbi:MAG: DNA repair protein RadC [Candidatus Aminicenantes bacterium]|nr:DNA repair protein RadC [Candidatus Aminicenantes bacterium]
MNLELKFPEPQEMPETTGEMMESSKLVFERMKPYANINREVFWTIYLTVKNEIIKAESCFMGTIDSSAVYPREVIRRALELSASSMILVHNHPSGDPEPSKPDKKITLDIALCARLFQIDVLDHVVISKERYYSMRDMGDLHPVEIKKRFDMIFENYKED